jgi:hypothetical protein
LPESVPGYHRYKEKNEQLQSLKTTSGESLIVASDPLGELARQGIHGEGLVEFGLDFVRRDKVDGKIYYLVNHSPQVIDAYVSLNSPAKSVVLMDPRTGDRGLGKLVSKKDLTEVYLQIQPGESLILNTFDTKKDVPAWQYNQKAGGAVELTGTWQLEFLEGGPVLPDSASFKELKSWTLLDQKAEAFSGTARYTLEFEHPFPEAPVCLLDLGDVRESARVWINGEFQDCLWSVPFSLPTDALKKGKNTLEIEVTNLSANRLRDMERRGEEWKIFYEINMVNRHYDPFDARDWAPMPSGLTEAVSLTPLRIQDL